MKRACAVPRCAGFAVPNGRGRCEAHRRTNAELGKPRHIWEAQSKAQRLAVPYCQTCGSTVDLCADHIVNHDRSRLQTLCRACNTRKRNLERYGERGRGRTC